MCYGSKKYSKHYVVLRTRSKSKYGRQSTKVSQYITELFKPRIFEFKKYFMSSNYSISLH